MSDVESIFQLVGRDFPEQEIQALLVGGHAVNAHGYTRATLDVDFMIVSDQEEKVRELMKARGYVNQSSHGSVLFCNRPGSSLRIDFLKTDPETMAALWNQKKTIHHADGTTCYVADLEHLIAMKLTALRSHFARRRGKDLPDILSLAKNHDWSFDQKLKPLIDQFGSTEVENELRTAWEAQT
ncbi:MAG: nucleotidyl transferase AbiEii/AbiGii toxin family protein [Verrucomicrobia bacterium]|nr:nucleotidyl transferase AbiEii/AbiGii toxin family protein [Verrucomicrobiota bacterium]MCH8510883.1 hypothetical protein [Kiritimatiellia bacterium]